jgi:putative ABC transport system permease protein
MLAIGATLTVRSLQIVESQAVGVDTDGLMFATPVISRRKYTDAPAILRYYDEAITRITAIPGVDGASLAATPPLGAGWSGFIQIEGYPADASTGAQFNLVDERYFRTIGVPLLKGRLLTAADDSVAEHVTVIDKAMADQYWPGADPIGKRFKAVSIGSSKDRWLTVVGVVGNIRTWALENEYMPTHYVSARQRPGNVGSVPIVVRSNLPAAAIIPAVRAAIKSIDASTRVDVTTFDERFRDVTSERRAKTNLLSSFAAIALLLAAIGVYGVLSYVVTLRTREIGIRMALGADSRRVVREMLRQLAIPVGTGILVGLVATSLMSRTFESLVFNLSPTAPGALAAGTSVLLMLVFVAALVPARRAARVDPLTALRSE